MKIVPGIFLLAFVSAELFSQTIFTPDLGIAVTINGSLVTLPWAGGFNAPVFSTTDLDGDGIKDLVVFEKDGNRLVTFRNTGVTSQVSYVFAPEFVPLFPPMNEWMKMVDIDCDGYEDIITSIPSGMKIYHNDFAAAGSLSFSLYIADVHSNYSGNDTSLLVPTVNIPVVDDIDYDGDTDVLTFSNSGNNIEYHRNMAIEQTGNCDTLILVLYEDCFGNMFLNPFYNSAQLGVSCRKANPDGRGAHIKERTSLHSGSCMIALDIDGDNDPDILNGDILGSNMLFIEMDVQGFSYFGISQDSAFPSYDVPADFPFFLNPHYFDVNNDGNKDFIVSPCTGNNQAENFANVWYYKNTTNNQTNVFSFQQNDLFVSQMIEAGSQSKVRFFDADSDGLMDMMIGNWGYYSPVPPFASGISYYRNTGTSSLPAFELITRDYALLNQFNAGGIIGIAPAFGDMDGDGDKDMLIGDSNGKLHLLTNSAATGQPADFTSVPMQVEYQAIDVGTDAAPFIVDLNRDGKNDLVIGKRNGRISYYENTGTAAAPFFGDSIKTVLGGINVTKPPNVNGYSYPVVYDNAGSYFMLVGSESGWIYRYDNIDGNLGGTFTLTDSMYKNIYEPSNSTLDITDINNDGLYDILTGNYAGGATLYKQTLVSVFELSPGNVFEMFPNPASAQVTIKFTDDMFGKNVTLRIYDIMGRKLSEQKCHAIITAVSTKEFSPGIYLVNVSNDKFNFTRTMIIQK